MSARRLDVAASIRAAREALGLDVEQAARRVTGAGGDYLREATDALRDVESGGNGAGYLDAAYWLRGLSALWLMGPGGWKPERGAYVRSDGARVDGNGTSSWCSWPGPARKDRPFLQDRMTEADGGGPIIRRDGPECPLRPGGEWEEGLAAALAEDPDRRTTAALSRWGCHQPGNRPCAGMRRMVNNSSASAPVAARECGKKEAT